MNLMGLLGHPVAALVALAVGLAICAMLCMLTKLVAARAKAADFASALRRVKVRWVMRTPYGQRQ
jgi:predicted DNA-binding ribbon-helix-helix protein